MTKRRLVLIISLGLISLLIIMGLLNFFKRGASEAEPTASHTENWATYLSTIDGSKTGSILVDLGFNDIAPIAEKTDRLIVEVNYANARENGLPADSEFDRLAEIENSIEAELVKASAIFVGRLYCDGRLDMYFYLKPGFDADTPVRQAMSRFPNYEFRTRINGDKDWETYLSFLYPAPIQMQSIQNSFVIRNLMEHGDNLEKERQVDHWIYFTRPGDREKFLSAIDGKGFRVESMEKQDNYPERPFKLHISRNDKVTPTATDQYIIELWRIADECSGVYDGWETFIVKE